MKVLVWSVLVIPFLCSCGGEEEMENENSSSVEQDSVVQEVAEEVVNTFEIGPDVVGIFILGNLVPELPEDLKIREFTLNGVDEKGNETEYRHNMIFNQLEDCLELIMDQGSGEHHEDRIIKEMIVLTNYYETPEKIAVGSTIEEFNVAYPDCKFWYSPVQDWYYCDSPTMEGVEFVIDPAQVDNKPSGSKNEVSMRMEDFKPAAEIIKIWVH